MPEKVENNNESFGMELTDDKAMVNGNPPKGERISKCGCFAVLAIYQGIGSANSRAPNQITVLTVVCWYGSRNYIYCSIRKQ